MNCWSALDWLSAEFERSGQACTSSIAHLRLRHSTVLDVAAGRIENGFARFLCTQCKADSFCALFCQTTNSHPSAVLGERVVTLPAVGVHLAARQDDIAYEWNQVVARGVRDPA